MFRIAWRLQRTGLIGMSLFGVLYGLIQSAAYESAAGTTAASRIAFGHQMESFGRTDGSLRTVARLVSPFYYVDRSTPLTPGGSFDSGATAGLLVVAVALAALAAWLMNVRDIGSPVIRRRWRAHEMTQLPSHNRLLRLPVLASLYERRLGLLAWTIGATIGALYSGTIGRSMVNLAKGGGSFGAYLTLAGHGNPYVALTGYIWFGIFQLVLVAFALIWVSRWSADDNEGRLEMQLSAPVSRGWVVGERAAAFLAGAVVVVAASSVGFYLSAVAGPSYGHVSDEECCQGSHSAKDQRRHESVSNSDGEGEPESFEHPVEEV